MKGYIDIQPKIKEALEQGLPVVALESTIISHGMPYPQNVKTATRIEEEVHRSGAVPATIALIKGRIKVGLSEDELETLGRLGPSVVKTSRRDLPAIIYKGIHGATTVAGTMLIAAEVGIQSMATGGIGGVHRGVSETLDISADLVELSRTNMAVVCSGIKFILDLKMTMEYLETLSVPVIGFKTQELPAFYTTKSGIMLDNTTNSVEEVAKICRTKWDLGLTGGVVIANPIPTKSELSQQMLDEALRKAMIDAEENNISGKGFTPFLLARIEHYTNGKSLLANIDLIINNARLAAELAVAFSQKQ